MAEASSSSLHAANIMQTAQQQLYALAEATATSSQSLQVPLLSHANVINT